MNSLVVLLWPLGMLLIFGVAWAFTRNADRQFSSRDNWVTRLTPSPVTLPALRGSLLFSGWVLAGTFVLFCAMTLLGAVLVVHQGHIIDTPIYNFTIDHQVHLWKKFMTHTTRVGNTWTTWGAGLTGAACIAVGMRRNRWLPLVAFVLVIVFDHYSTLGLRHIFGRPGTPNSPGGTYPSGGCERVILFYGLLAYFLWREFSPTRNFAVWAAAVIGALAYNEAFSRAYLTLHWFTDILSGLLYGVLFLAVYIVSVRIVAGPAEGRPVSPEVHPQNGAAAGAAVKALV